MADGGLPLTPASAGLLQQLALEYGGTPAIPQVQRSQYLADALRQMSTQGQDIKSPLALGSDLLAEALLQHGRGQSNRALMNEIAASQSNLAADAQRGIYAPDGAAAGGAGGAPSSADLFGAGPPAAAGAPQGNTALAAALSPADEAAAINTVYGEARGEPTVGRQAVAGVLANRAALTGLPIAELAAQPHQFAGFSAGRHLDPNSAIYKSIQADIDPVLERQIANPAGTADHFYAPAAMPNGQRPSWDNGSGQMIGHQDFLSLGYGGKPPLGAPSPFGQSSAQASSPNTSAGAQESPAPQPFQISTGPDPSVASPGAQGPGGASPFRVAQQAPPVGAAAPAPAGGAGAGPPTGPYATPQEAAQIRYLLTHPPGSIQYQQGLALAQQVQQRVRTPLAPPKDMMWGPNGQAIPMPGTQYQNVSGGPAGIVQADPFGQYHTISNPNAAPPPPGTMLSGAPGGGVQVTPYGGFGERPMTDAELRAHGAPPGAAGTIDQATGKITLTNPGADLKTLQSSRDSWRNSDETKKANEAISAYNGLATALTTAAGKNNGVLDTAAIDSYLRGINPGMGARNATVQMFLGHLGLPQELEGHINSVMGNGYLTPQTLNQMLGIIRSYATAHGQVAGQMAQNDLRAMPHGITMEQLGETLPPLLAPPQVQWLNGAPPPPAAPAIAGAPPGFDPNSTFGRAAMGLIQQHGYRFQGGHLVNAQGQVVQ